MNGSLTDSVLLRCLLCDFPLTYSTHLRSLVDFARTSSNHSDDKKALELNLSIPEDVKERIMELHAKRVSRRTELMKEREDAVAAEIKKRYG